MGNFTWFLKCVSDQSVEEPVVDIVEFLARQYAKRGWWFDGWVSTLTKSQRNIVEMGAEMSTLEYRNMLTSDSTLPRKISMITAMSIFHDHKFYGYIDEGLRELLTDFGTCLSEDIGFMMMIGLHEGFGPVAMGWVGKSDQRRFVSMMGFEHRCFGDQSLLTGPMRSLKEYMTEKHGGILQGSDYELVAQEYRLAIEFRREVLDSLDNVDWESEDIVSWLGRHGFEEESASTTAKTYNLMGCNQQ